jgi:hypothetical protein
MAQTEQVPVPEWAVGLELAGAPGRAPEPGVRAAEQALMMAREATLAALETRK